jgi:hypothetical protein
MFLVKHKKRLLQYWIITLVLIIIFVILVIEQPVKYFIRSEEYFEIVESTEALYTRELSYFTKAVTFENTTGEQYAFVYTEESPYYDVFYINDGVINLELQVDTQEEGILDVMVVEDKLYFTTIDRSLNNYFRLYSMDLDTFDKALVYEDTEVYRLEYLDNQFVLYTYVYYNDDINEIYVLNDDYTKTLIGISEEHIYDYYQYQFIQNGEVIGSFRTSNYVDGNYTNAFGLVNTHSMTLYFVLLDDLETPLMFTNINDVVYGYNDDSLYRLDCVHIQEINVSGHLYTFKMINEQVYRIDNTLYDEEFNVIQKDDFYTSDFQKHNMGAVLISDDNNTIYAIDNEFFAVVHQLPDEPFVWAIPLWMRLTYLAFSTLTLGAWISLGQTSMKLSVLRKSES